MKNIIYIPVEVKVREFYAKTLLAVELYFRGFDVVIGTMGMIREIAKSSVPGIFFDKHLCVIGDKELKDRGFKLYAYDEEGIVYINEKEYKESRLVGVELLDGIFLWGNDQLKLLEEYNSELVSKSYIVSNPRIDLLRYGKDIFYSEISNRLVKKYGDYVIVNLNFSGLDTSEKIEDYINRFRDRLSPDSVELTRKVFFREIDYKKNTLILIKNIAERMHINFIIRPHPSDSLKNYKDYFRGCSNIYVIRKYDANSWMYGAKAVLHMGCTTAFEAYQMGISSIFYYPYNDINKSKNIFPNMVSQSAQNEEEVKCLINKCINNKINNTNIQLKDVKERVFLDMKKKSVEMIADILENNNYSNSSEDFDYNARLIDRIRDARMGVYSWLNEIRGKEAKFPTTKIKEMEIVVNKCKDILRKNEEVNLKKVRRNVFYLYH